MSVIRLPTRLPTGRHLVVDVLLVGFVCMAMVFGSDRAAETQVPPREPLDALAYGFMAVAAAALLLRRAYPVQVLATVATAVFGYLAFSYPYGPIMFALSLAVFSAAQRLPLRRSLAACGVAVLAYLLPDLLGLGEHPANVDVLGWAVAAPAGFVVAPWAVGTVLRINRESEIRSRAEEGRRIASEERLRMAREVHDVVGHGLAVINMQAGIALHVLDRRPEQAKVALDAIKRTSKDALEELRGTLAVFRRMDDLDGSAGSAGMAGAAGTEADAPRRPTPGLDQVETLVSAMADSGLAVDLEVSGDRADVPASVDLAGYRIVQESLTNVLRHAGAATARVRIGYHPDEVVLEITDNGRTVPAAPAHSTAGGTGSGGGHGGGHGIGGMRERAAALGGTLQAGPRVEGGFRVLATLPRGEFET